MSGNLARASAGAQPAGESSNSANTKALHPTRERLLADLRSFCRTSDLMRSTGVTRQRIAQILRQWEADGTVRRVIEPGTTLRFLWALPGVPYDPGYRPAVAPSRLRLASLAMILSCLRPAAFHRPARLARHLGLSVYAVLPVVRQLEHAGLVRTTRVSFGIFVSITQAGLAHADRDPAAPLAPVAEIGRDGGEQRLRFIEVLATLGDPQAIDCTGVISEDLPAGYRVNTWVVLHGLIRAGLVERVEASGRRPCYRLTRAGLATAAVMAETRTPPTREELAARIARHRARMRQAQSCGSESRRTASPLSPGMRRTLQLLESGPMTTSAISAQLIDIHRHRRSVYLILTSLVRRGLVRQATRGWRANTWALANPGDSASEAPEIRRPDHVRRTSPRSRSTPISTAGTAQAAQPAA